MSTQFEHIEYLQPALDAFVRRGVTKRTAEIDTIRIRPFCEKYSNRPIASITPQEVYDWFEKLADRLGSVTVESHKQTIKTFFNWCVKNRNVLLDESPAVFIKPKRRQSARYKAANEKDLFKVMDYLQRQLDDSKPAFARDLLAFRLAYENGNRQTELARLGTKDVNLALRNPLLTSDGTVIYIAQSGVGKKGIVKVRFTEYTSAIYKYWQTIRPKSAMHRVFVATGGSFPGQPLKPNGFTQIFVRRCKECNVPVYRTHAIRHLKGTKVADKWSPKVAASVLGITTETAIMHYYNEDDQSVIDAVSL